MQAGGGDETERQARRRFPPKEMLIFSNPTACLRAPPPTRFQAPDKDLAAAACAGMQVTSLLRSTGSFTSKTKMPKVAAIVEVVD